MKKSHIFGIIIIAIAIVVIMTTAGRRQCLCHFRGRQSTGRKG